MRYAVVALAPADEEQVAAYFTTLTGRGFRVEYDGYAPRMWIVSYGGTPRQLTDLLWPDDTPKDKLAMRTGIVIRIPDGGSLNGMAARDLWALFQDD